ncbi:peptidase m28 [Neobacillus bataviensis LMG 21833]|uniref:Vacuolar membrane protease n=1 Tax=Neobacillus bataviensis LMG 21833 TaxID=1117379 RepID=K6DQG3_9BACI|nr:M20/M25/M40 family metallo-hydrolase [Neobacillus bataviensis]EKN70438.1 peptidase m28 [Neobacillus bataviensis LMG 21833]
MEIIPSAQVEPQSRKSVKKSVLVFIILAAIILGTILLSLLQLQSPKVIPADQAAKTFSADSAFSYLEGFTVAPHPLGSKEHDNVRDYLVTTLKELGVNPEIQKANSLYTRPAYISGGTVENIVGKIEGTNSKKAIMLVAHYDSVPGGPGAADDGAGVAAIIETVRVLKEMKPLQSDVIILLTDGEENGLLGSKAFTEEHLWVKDVGLVLNFEARGNEGPAFMFETSDNNSWLVNEFVQAAPTPVAHSFIYSLYKLMPNDTDLTVFKAAGLNGLNFAFGEGLGHYHTTSDNPGELSKNSLQHHGEYMLSLVRHFGDLDLTQTGKGNTLFFNILGTNMITYSEDLVIPFMLFAVVLFVLTIIHGARRKKLSLRGTLAGLLIMLGGSIGSFVIGLGLWSLLTAILSEKEWLMGSDSLIGTTYLISFSLMIFAYLSFLYKMANKKVMVGSLAMGALLMWLLLAVAASLFLKAGSYVLVWPLIFGLLGENIFFRLKENSWAGYLVTAVFAIPGLLLFSPVVYLIYILASMKLASALMVFVFLGGALLIPIFSTLKIKSNGVIPAILLGVGLLVMVINSINLLNMPTEKHPKASDITYFMDADTQKAFWAARQPLDEYTAIYINKDVKEGNTSTFFPILNWDVTYAKADVYNVDGPSMTVLSDRTENDKRMIEYQVKTNRQAEEIVVQSLSSMNISSLLINGKDVELNKTKFTKKAPLLFAYIAGQTGELNVKVTIDANDTMEWIVADRSYSIPETKGERSPKFSTYGDNSFIMKTIRD